MLPNNLGVIKYKNGDMFIGEFIDGNINGSGILYIAESNSIYVGDKFNTENYEWLDGLNLNLEIILFSISQKYLNSPNIVPMMIKRT